MVYDFLKKYQQELISEKLEINEKIDFLDSKLLEERKFLSLLEDTNNSYFSEFSPRKLNPINNDKANEVRNTILKFEEELSLYKTQLEFYDSRLSEIKNIIGDNLSSNSNAPDLSFDSTFSDSSITDLSVIKSELVNLKDLVLLDPYRASIILDSIIKKI